MTTDRPTFEHRRTRSELDPRFQKIGISAVAAAARYPSESRNPAYAPVESNDTARAATAET